MVKDNIYKQKFIHHVYFRAMAKIDEKLLEVLVCPVSKKSLVLNEETNELICEESGLAYPIRDGIPVMLPEEARKI